MKTYVYVDAENVSFETFKSNYEMLISTSINVVGKFYGGKEVLGSSVCNYLMLGLEFVETASLSRNKKNLTDMKIIVDCMGDVLAEQSAGLSVYLFSKDSDFLPLIYKLTSLSVEVHSLVLNESSHCENDVGALVKELYDKQYLPVNEMTALGKPYDDIKALVGDKFDDCIIKDYVEQRSVKFIKMFNVHEEYKGILESISVEDWCFYKIVEELGISKNDEFELFNMYTTRMWGVTIKPKVCREIIGL